MTFCQPCCKKRWLKLAVSCAQPWMSVFCARQWHESGLEMTGGCAVGKFGISIYIYIYILLLVYDKRITHQHSICLDVKLVPCFPLINVRMLAISENEYCKSSTVSIPTISTIWIALYIFVLLDVGKLQLLAGEVHQNISEHHFRIFACTNINKTPCYIEDKPNIWFFMIFQYHFIHTFYRCFSTNHHRLNSERHLSPLRLHPIEADAPGLHKARNSFWPFLSKSNSLTLWHKTMMNYVYVYRSIYTYHYI